MSKLRVVINSARELLQDTREKYRFSTERLVGVMNLAFRDTRRLRPDLYTGKIAEALPEYTELDLDTTDFPIDETYLSAIAEYVAGYTAMSDDEFTVDGRAQALLGRFTSKLVGITA